MIAKFIQKEPLVWGPIFLLFTIALAVRIAIPYDLLLLAAGGFFLSARMQIRGCCYALVLLGLVTVVRHAFLVEDHLWALGIEGSLAIAFFITALSFEQGANWIHSLESQIQIRKSALENLEEELAKTQESAQEQQIVFQEKVAGLQKELEELQSEHSSILILNEVLRKTTARHLQETQESSAALKEARIEIEQLKSEYNALDHELICLKATDVLAENQKLMEQLNQARFDKEQTHLINETLARLHLKEFFKAKDADSESASLKEQLQAAHQEIRRLEEPLREEIAKLKKECAGYQFEFEKANQEANGARQELLKLHEIQAERNFLKERLEAAKLENESIAQKAQNSLKDQIAKLQSEFEKTKEKADQVQSERNLLKERLDAAMFELGSKKAIDPHFEERLKFAEEKMLHLSQIEPLFKQLKKQFEEKNHILHQTRADLFKSDTELQKLKIEKSSLDLNPIPKEVEEELEALAAQIEALEEENRELQELITALSNPQERKKKVKTQRPSEDQTLLF